MSSLDVTSLNHRRAVHRCQRVSVGDLLERVTYAFPDKDAIVGLHGACAAPEHQRMSYRDADALASQIANGLLSRGLAAGDRVMMLCENSVEAYLFKLGIAKAGLVCVPVNPALLHDVLAHILEMTQPAFLVVDAELWPPAGTAFTDAGVLPNVTIPIGGDAVPGSLSFPDFVRDQPTSEPDVEIHGDDIWQILFTSGTTSLPKAVMVSHHGSYFAAYSFTVSLTRGLHVECDLKLATYLPMIYHAGDQTFSFPAFLAGGTLVIGRGLAAQPLAQAITSERITALVAGSPLLVAALVDVVRSDPDAYDASSLRVMVYGWSALPPATLAALKDLCGEEFVAIGILGQTESNSSHRFWPDKWPELYERTAPAVNYVGVPNPILASTLMDETGCILDRPGIPGEAVYRSPSVMAGYYRDEQATADAFRGDWLHSGDVCVYGEQGLRIMVDRYKDIVKTGGENVSSLRVESVLQQHPSVAKAAVVGLPHPRWGEAVTAVVILAGDEPLSESELIAFCRARLAGFESPKRIIVTDRLPETVGGKVLKYKLRQRYQATYD